MGLLFLSFLGLEWLSIIRSIDASLIRIASFLVFRLLVLPVAVFYLFAWLWPDYALAALLISGVSVGVVGPFLAVQLGVDANLTVILVVISSLIVPVTLPALCHALAGAHMAVSFLSMAEFLAMMVVLPAIAAQTLQRMSPAASLSLLRWRRPASLAMFALTNLGVFSRYAPYFRQSFQVVALALLAACLIAVLLLVAGLVWSRLWRRGDGVQFVIGTVIVNNILVVVLASQFFGPREPTVAALYTIPFFAMIFPLRRLAGQGVFE
jgi:BASS family bile acid:Na+ symporter